MNQASALAKRLEQMKMEEGLKLIEEANRESLYFDVINDAMCIMHKDGSVNITESMGNGAVATEVISSGNIVKVLHHYRPFSALFKGGMQ